MPSGLIRNLSGTISMDSIINTFHIDWKIIIAQAVNFGIVFVVLYIFALKPLNKLMAERAEKIKKGVEDKIKELKDVKDKPELDPIKKAMDELNTAVQKVGAAMYKKEEPVAEAPKQEGPVDAEFKDVSEEKK